MTGCAERGSHLDWRTGFKLGCEDELVLLFIQGGCPILGVVLGFCV
jgi:hypothetical protein